MSQCILVVDDDKEIRELLRLYIEKDGYKLVQAQNGLEALEMVNSEQIDLAVIDIMMPEMNGYELIKELKKYGDLPIIVVSAKSESSEKILGLDLGAEDYVTKPFEPLEVVARVRAQLRRREKVVLGTDTQILTQGMLKLDPTACTLQNGEESIQLTATEYNMMKLFMQNPGRVFTKQQIYETVWQEWRIVDDNTIMVAISKLRGKLPLNCGISITTIRGLGYRLEVLK